jgi:hypothetical protein
MLTSPPVFVELLVCLKRAIIFLFLNLKKLNKIFLPEGKVWELRDSG